MSESLSIELQDASSGENLGLLITDVKIYSGISRDMTIKLGCKLRGSYAQTNHKLKSLNKVLLSIEGGFDSPKFHTTVAEYSITAIPNNDVLDINITLADRYNIFREIHKKGVFYNTNLYGIYSELYGNGFAKILDSKIKPILLFDTYNQNKYPTHPIYVHYNETSWEFFRRALLEHGLSYNWMLTTDGFELVIFPDNQSLEEYFKEHSDNSHLYNYTLNLKPKGENSKDNLLNYIAHSRRSGHYSNSKIKQFNEYLVHANDKNDNDVNNDLIEKHLFIKEVKYIHHPAYNPEVFLESSYTFPDEKFNVTRQLKTRFNSVNQAQLNECVNTEAAIIDSDKAEQIAARIRGVFLLAGASLKLDNKPDELLESDDHLVTSSIVEIKSGDNVDVTQSSKNPKLEYNVQTTVITQEKAVNYHTGMPDQPKVGSLSGVFPYISEYDGSYDIVSPDDIGNVRVVFPMDYEICPDNEQDYRYYVPRVLNNNYESAPYYPETELYVMFIDGNPNKPIIYGALSNSQTNDLNMKDHPNRHYHAYGQGSYFGYTSDDGNIAESGNSIMFQSRHTGGVSWVAQSNQPAAPSQEKGELALDQVIATTATRTNLVDGEYHENLGYTDGIPNHQKKVIPAVNIEDQRVIKTEEVKTTSQVNNNFKAGKLSEEELEKIRKEIAEQEN